MILPSTSRRSERNVSKIQSIQVTLSIPTEDKISQALLEQFQRNMQQRNCWRSMDIHYEKDFFTSGTMEINQFSPPYFTKESSPSDAEREARREHFRRQLGFYN
jgi:hypothetical protein